MSDADLVLGRIAKARLRVATVDGEPIPDEAWLAAGLSAEDLFELRRRQQTFRAYDGLQHEEWRAMNDA